MNEVFRDIARLLIFRLSADRFDAFGRRHLAVGFVLTWLAGVGRYWDSPRAFLLQRAGAGSVIYVVCLAALLWVVIKPVALNPRFGFRGLLTFVCLTSPPALLYAIPVERFFPLEVAAGINVWFLAIVALWRVALLFFHLRRAVKLDFGACSIALLLPVSSIIVVLAALNLEQAVFDIMGGLREVQRTPADATYALIVTLSFLSLPVFLGSFIGWIACIASAQLERRRLRRTNADS